MLRSSSESLPSRNVFSLKRGTLYFQGKIKIRMRRCVLSELWTRQEDPDAYVVQHLLTASPDNEYSKLTGNLFNVLSVPFFRHPQPVSGC